jgi:hypothetical protein
LAQAQRRNLEACRPPTASRWKAPRPSPGATWRSCSPR